MSNDEILARIAGDVMNVGNGNFGAIDITIGMTKELYARLCRREYLIMEGQAMTLFGCKIKLFENCGLWWIVGYEGEAEEDR